MGFKGVWRVFHTVAPASLHLNTIRFKVYLERSFEKKKISLVSKDPATSLHGEVKSDSRFSGYERICASLPFLGGRKKIMVMCRTGLVEEIL
ncbi:hypothetical protein MA16_Dca000161 [Dendrobium catenatum]|uniref:Uncharacterized protein n=1 Tax=Dendrobium catenatum TaxID=906689 RepID=A0A2I0WT31_9ASPA|nr:hypothetical protein MA16_Dca000161 [Dendrobium catenatum]